MKVLTSREKQLADGTIFRNVDMLLTKDEAKRMPLESFAATLEKGVGNAKLHEVESIKFEEIVVQNAKLQTVHINKEKKIVTVVFSDGTKQVVKCSPEDSFDTEIGFALACTRAVFGSKTKVRKFIEKNADFAKVKETKVKEKPTKSTNSKKPTGGKKRNG